MGRLLVSREADGMIRLASVSPFGNEVIRRTNKDLMLMVVARESVRPELVDLAGDLRGGAGIVPHELVVRRSTGRPPI